MAVLRLFVLAAVVAGVAAELSAHDRLKERLKSADAACRNEKNPECKDVCFQKHTGILDKDGLYVESKAAEIMAIMVYKRIINQETLDKVTNNCNKVNDNIKTGCERARQVRQCFDDEIYKIGGKRVY